MTNNFVMHKKTFTEIYLQITDDIHYVVFPSTISFLFNWYFSPRNVSTKEPNQQKYV